MLLTRGLKKGLTMLGVSEHGIVTNFWNLNNLRKDIISYFIILLNSSCHYW
jgi:hypothetical protein